MGLIPGRAMDEKTFVSKALNSSPFHSFFSFKLLLCHIQQSCRMPPYEEVLSDLS